MAPARSRSTPPADATAPEGFAPKQNGFLCALGSAPALSCALRRTPPTCQNDRHTNQDSPRSAPQRIQCCGAAMQLQRLVEAAQRTGRVASPVESGCIPRFQRQRALNRDIRPRPVPVIPQLDQSVSQVSLGQVPDPASVRGPPPPSPYCCPPESGGRHQPSAIGGHLQGQPTRERGCGSSLMACSKYPTALSRFSLPRRS